MENKRIYHFSEEARKNISEAHKGKFFPNKSHFQKGHIPWSKTGKFSEETKRKMSLSHKGKIPWNKGIKMPKEFGEKLSKVKKDKPNPLVSIALKGRKLSKEHVINIGKGQFNSFQKILHEIPELEKQGFRCIPILNVVPDIIAIKGENIEVYAIEIEGNKKTKPNYKKYDKNNYRKYFKDFIWIFRQ